MSKPNIIFMFVDDLGIGDLSCFNTQSKLHTEHIDQIASEGMRFCDCHASSALCTPSRYGVMTGRYNWRSRLKMGVLPGVATPLIEEGRETLGTMMQKQGYRTACVGKWHLGMDWVTKNGYKAPNTFREPGHTPGEMRDGIDFEAKIQNGPNTRGFDYFYGMPASLDQAPYTYIENDHVTEIPECIIGIDDLDRKGASHQTELERGLAAPGFDPQKVVPDMDRKVLELVDAYANDAQPFFIYYPTLAVHGPLCPAEAFKGKSGIGLYGDFVLQMDDFVGKLDTLLHQKGIADNTIFIFASDNGCSGIVDYPALAKLGHHPSSIYRGKKSDIWEGGHRVPFIIRWPGHIEADTTCDQMICLTDLFATLAEITGFEYGDDAGEDSFSAWSLMQGSKEPIRDSVMHHAIYNYSIRKGDWKLEFCEHGGGFDDLGIGGMKASEAYQLYNLKDDVREQHNVWGQYPEMEKEMTELARSIIENGRSTPGKPQENHPAFFWPGLDWMKTE